MLSGEIVLRNNHYYYYCISIVCIGYPLYVLLRHVLLFLFADILDLIQNTSPTVCMLVVPVDRIPGQPFDWPKPPLSTTLCATFGFNCLICGVLCHTWVLGQSNGTLSATLFGMRFQLFCIWGLCCTGVLCHILVSCRLVGPYRHCPPHCVPHAVLAVWYAECSSAPVYYAF